jgi:hypothetical protein
MSILLVAYDLADAAATNAPLAQAIMRLGSRWARPLSTLWFIETAATPADVEAALAPWIAAEDGLVVQAVAGEAALANTMVRWSGRRVAATGLVPARAGSVLPWPDRSVTADNLPALETGVAAAA